MFAGEKGRNSTGIKRTKKMYLEMEKLEDLVFFILKIESNFLVFYRKNSIFFFF